MMSQESLHTSIALECLNTATRRDIQGAIERIEKGPGFDFHQGPTFQINPSLEIVEDAGKGEFFLVFVDPVEHTLRLERGQAREILALKVLAEGLDPRQVAASHGASVEAIYAAIWEAVDEGLVIPPKPKIERPEEAYPPGAFTEGLLRPEVFSIQWHVTQRCDLDCRHCYDRSERTPMPMERARYVLEELRDFCWAHGVRGHVCLSGGNPFLYPHFFDVYGLAVEMGFMVSILGNPVPRDWIETMTEIALPNYYQVSLEGLEARNDAIRGRGHYRRTLDFLSLLREVGIESSVMLTLTRDNIDDVLPLARVLEDYTNGFTFNRLSAVGKGAALCLPPMDMFWRFLNDYVAAYPKIGCLYFKDNLINVILEKEGRSPFDGCTGFGCGAAFNFVAVLSDGEIHACRKFPSYIGNIFDDGLQGAYYSELAVRYRLRPIQCRTCRLSPACGGCFASSNTFSKDIFMSQDPYCPLTDKDK